jgi:hypothetical protein
MRVLLGLLLIVGMAGCAKEIKPASVRPVSLDPALSQYCRESVGQVAFGVYHDKQKIGWATLEFLLTENEVAPQVHNSFSLYIRINIDNRKETIETRQENIYDLTGEGPLVRVESEEIYNGKRSSSEQAVKTATGYAVDMLIEGQRRQFQTATSQDTLTEQLRVIRWLRSLPKANDTLHLSEFSFDTLRTTSQTGDLPFPDEKVTFVFLGRRLARWSGVPVTVSNVKWIYEDIEFTTGRGSAVMLGLSNLDVKSSRWLRTLTSSSQT